MVSNKRFNTGLLLELDSLTTITSNFLLQIDRVAMFVLMDEVGLPTMDNK